jgi:hypothetical protein
MTTVDMTVMDAIMRYHVEHGHYPPRFEVAPYLLREMTQREFTFQVVAGAVPCLIFDQETHAPVVVMRTIYKTVKVPVVPVGQEG